MEFRIFVIQIHVKTGSMKIATIVGARPQFVKAAAFSRKLKESTSWSEVIIHTGQHYDANMSEVFFTEMEIPKADYHLEINSMPRDQMLATMQAAITELLLQENPDLVLVYGDTNSTLAGARAAKKLKIKLAHVEAGLRSYNNQMPEELNRVETDMLSDFLFVPAQQAAQNLKNEGVGGQVAKVGDIMYDAVKYYSTYAYEKSTLPKTFFDKPYSLLTLHRQENTDVESQLKNLFQSIDRIAESNRVVMPLHPRTKKKMEEFGITTKAELIEPVGYFDMLSLISHSNLVMTDSGGLQKEAYYLSKFCITLREETEWTELVDIGANKVCGSHPDVITSTYQQLINEEFRFKAFPYGEGDTAHQIIKAIGLYMNNPQV